MFRKPDSGGNEQKHSHRLMDTGRFLQSVTWGKVTSFVSWPWRYERHSECSQCYTSLTGQVWISLNSSLTHLRACDSVCQPLERRLWPRLEDMDSEEMRFKKLHKGREVRRDHEELESSWSSKY